MKTLKENEKWSVSLKATQTTVEESPRPKIGDDDGISDRTMNAIIVLFMLITLSVSIVASAQPDPLKYRIMLRQAMLDMDRLDFDKAAAKLLEVRANSEENANVNHMLGMCYLYGQDASEKAVFYLNKAAKHAAVDFESWDLDEKRAPIESVYHLAKAYENLQDFAKAARYYEQYLATINNGADNGSRTYAMIHRNMEKCKAATIENSAEVLPENVVLNQ
ncbi:MAG: tetratricopeptide repeat-containing protein [Flavobacteriales bacterium]|nr:tetratricopeptide repeat-containing protein [Flavobacteriales bacterium]